MPRGAPRLRKRGVHQNAIGERVRVRRRELKLTQDALCARLTSYSGGGWSPTEADVYRIERHIRIVSDLEMVVVAAALECDILWLLGIESGLRPAIICKQWYSESEQ